MDLPKLFSEGLYIRFLIRKTHPVQEGDAIGVAKIPQDRLFRKSSLFSFFLRKDSLKTDAAVSLCMKNMSVSILLQVPKIPIFLYQNLDIFP